jgi:hypothetical protein
VCSSDLFMRIQREDERAIELHARWKKHNKESKARHIL